MKKSSMQCQKKEDANPGQLFWAFGPHQQGANVYTYMYTSTVYYVLLPNTCMITMYSLLL